MAEQEYLPLFQRKRLKNTMARLIELAILFLLLSLLGYRLLHIGSHGFVWLLAFICESWFTFTWILVLNIKWTPTKIETYPERLQQQRLELPGLDMFVTTADPVLEPPILTVNTVVSLLSVDYPVNKLACYVSDDAASPLTYYCLVEASKFAKLWVPFCKKYDIPVRAPFRYFDDRKSAFGNNSTEFQREFERMKDEYVNLCHKIEDASNKPEPCNLSGDFEEFSNIDRKNHPTIIKVIWENEEDDGDGVPHLIYVSREKNPNHPHHYKAGAMNVLTRVSGVLTNAAIMMNVDCDMFVNNPQVVLHSMCLLLGDDEHCGFVQFPQTFYDGLKDDPFGNQMIALLTYIGRGLAGLQGPYYGGTGCFHRRKIIYGLSPSGKSGKGMLSFEDSEKTFGKAPGFNNLVYQTLSSLSNSRVNRVGSLSDSMEEAFQVADCNFESNTMWGKKIGWIYGSTTEDVLTGMNIHSRGWRSMWLATEPHGFLGCAPSCGPDTLVQQKRWATGLLEIIFGPTNPVSATLNGHMEFRQLLSYLWILTWGMRSIFEICYATLPAYCLITNTNFLPKVDEPAIVIPISIFLIFNMYSMWEYFHADQSIRSWWNNQRMSRVIAMTAWLFGFITVIIKLLGISDTIFEVTKKEQTTNNSEDDTDQKLAGRFTFDGSPTFVPGITILVINLAALGCGFGGLMNQGRASGELVCSAWVVLCFWSFFKGFFGKGKYGIPFLTIYKSVGLGLAFLQFCRLSS